MIRIITARYLARLKGANERHQTRHANQVLDIAGLRAELEASYQRNGQLVADNAVLQQQLAERPTQQSSDRALLLRVRNAEDRARALDERLSALQEQNERSYHLAYDAHQAVAS